MESWASGVMRPIFEEIPWSWLYFVTFILFGTFIIFNLLVGVIVNNVEKAHDMDDETDAKKTTSKEEESAALRNENPD
ncbi:ion transporter [Aeribacillus pallidus]|uniref:ion transporter n=1 Tax=Aeribacillus pallidus TaxID=33936 RepID=UPI003D1B7936